MWADDGAAAATAAVLEEASSELRAAYGSPLALQPLIRQTILRQKTDRLSKTRGSTKHRQKRKENRPKVARLW